MSDENNSGDESVEQKSERETPALNGISDEWLMMFYEQYSEQFRADNARIWGTGAIFIPISLAAYAAFFELTEQSLPAVIVLGIASSSLMLVWNLIANRLRQFQERSIGVVKDIETKIEVLLRERPLEGPNGSGRRLRWGLFWAVTVGWVVLVFLVGCDVI